MVTIKEQLEQAFKVDPKLTLKHAQTIIEGVKKSNYYKVRTMLFPPVEKKKSTLKQGRKGSKATSSTKEKLLPETTYTKIDDDTIEAAILFCINNGDITPPLISQMISFYDKIRGKDDKIKDDIDMEEFRLIGAAVEDSE